LLAGLAGVAVRIGFGQRHVAALQSEYHRIETKN
jgi:hypothetical protein